MRFRRRILVLPFSAAVILALVAYKQGQTYPQQSSSFALPTLKRRAPLFEGLDSNNQFVKFERYVGRHEIIVAFFDGELGPAQDEALLTLRKAFDRLEAAGAVVVGISTALPQQNRKAFEAVGAYPFPLISDPTLEIHRKWGRLKNGTGKPVPAVFLVDRAGNIEWADGKPQPVRDVAVALDRVIDGQS